jgi:hypothetical protein
VEPGAAPPPSRRRHQLEGVVLVALGLLLAVATARDIVRAVGVDNRVRVDKRTWVHFTHRNIRLIGVTSGKRGGPDVACAPPAATAGYKLCLMLGGSAHTQFRVIEGGYHLTLAGSDIPSLRSHCFGVARRHRLCGSPTGGA